MTFLNKKSPSYSECLDIARGNYSRAIKELGLDIMQAFAYVMDETELLRGSKLSIQSVLMTIAVFKIGAELGLTMDSTDPYAREVLEDLEGVYVFSKSTAFDDAQCLDDMKHVKDKFL